MQVQNAVSIEFFKNPKRFADLLNGHFFIGGNCIAETFSIVYNMVVTGERC